MTEVELKAIEERCQMATPGPWRWSSYDGFIITLQSGDHTAWSNAVIRAIDTDAETDEETHNAAVDVPADEDAEFIALARTDVPALCTEVRRLRDLLRRTDEHVAELGHLNKRLREALAATYNEGAAGLKTR